MSDPRDTCSACQHERSGCQVHDADDPGAGDVIFKLTAALNEEKRLRFLWNSEADKTLARLVEVRDERNELRLQAMQGYRLATSVVEAPQPLPPGLRKQARRTLDMHKGVKP